LRHHRRRRVPPGAQDESAGGRRGDLGCDQIPAQRTVLRRTGDRFQDLDQILEAGRRAPSAGNQQAWDFVVCTDREQLAQLARVGPAAQHVAGSAATIALVASRSDDADARDLIQFDLGQATMSVMLAAADLGIGSAHAGVGDQELARRLLGFPEDRFCVLLIALGVPADAAQAGYRIVLASGGQKVMYFWAGRLPEVNAQEGYA
jgi:nitroreductase